MHIAVNKKIESLYYLEVSQNNEGYLLNEQPIFKKK